jgi:hypothetical protein
MFLLFDVDRTMILAIVGDGLGAWDLPIAALGTLSVYLVLLDVLRSVRP